VLRKAVLGMMAKNVLRKAIARKLRIFPGKFKKKLH
jgi:ribosomal protein L13